MQPTETPFSRALNLTSAISNAINTIIGAGIITLPYTILVGGLYFALAAMALLAAALVYTSDLMIRASKRLEKKDGVAAKSYAELCERTLGRAGDYVLATMTFLMMFGAMGVYAVLLKIMLGSIVSDIMGGLFRYEKAVFVAAFVVLTFPLCVLRDISKLGYASFISTALVFVIVLICAVQSPKYYKRMNELTPEKMTQNEETLHVDRAAWICGRAATGGDIYESVAPGFPIAKAKNFRGALQHVRAKGVCRIDSKPEQVHAAVASFADAVEFEEPTAAERPASWLGVLQRAHAGELFGRYSLRQRFGGRVEASGVFKCLSVYVGAFLVQQATFEIFEQLGRKEVREWRVVLAASFAVVYVLYLGAALAGYLGQAQLVGETIFDKLKLRFFDGGQSLDVAINAARIMLVITILLTFPMQNFYARRNFFILFFKILKRFREVPEDIHNPPAIYFYTTSVVLFSLSLIIGVFLDNIFVLYAFIGSIFASPMALILPTLCYMCAEESLLAHLKTKKKEGAKALLFEVILPSLVCLFGVFLTITATTMTIIDTAKQ